MLLLLNCIYQSVQNLAYKQQSREDTVRQQVSLAKDWRSSSTSLNRWPLKRSNTGNKGLKGSDNR